MTPRNDVDEQVRTDMTATKPLASGSSHVLEVRVSYYETDGQRRVHHANYLNYFERGRVEMLRTAGVSYKEFETGGLMLVVTEMNVRYLGAAEFDDVLELETTVIEIRAVRIRHRYVLRRHGEVLVEAESTIACVDTAGKPTKLPPSWRGARQ